MDPDPPKRLQNEATDNMASMAVNELGPMLTATEVADMLHLHVNTVKRRFRLDDVMKCLSQNR